MIHFNNKIHHPNWGLYNCRTQCWVIKPQAGRTALEARLLKNGFTQGKRSVTANAFRTSVFVAKPGDEITLQKKWDAQHD